MVIPYILNIIVGPLLALLLRVLIKVKSPPYMAVLTEL